jgi:hypothetical protein
MTLLFAGTAVRRLGLISKRNVKLLRICGLLASCLFVGQTSAQAAPQITSLSPASGPVGTLVTITGLNFGPMQGTSTVTFNGTIATPTNWSAASIVVLVPAGVATGNVIVMVASVASNGKNFKVVTSANDSTGKILESRAYDSKGCGLASTGGRGSSSCHLRDSMMDLFCLALMSHKSLFDSGYQARRMFECVHFDGR